MGTSTPPDREEATRAILRFAGIFLGCTVGFHLVFNHFESLVGLVYVRSISYAASFMLHIIGLGAEVSTDLS